MSEMPGFSASSATFRRPIGRREGGMSRVRFASVLVSLCAATAVAAPARAQEPPPTDPSVTTTTPLDPASTTTTLPPDPGVPTTTTTTTVPPGGEVPPTTDTTLPPPPEDPAAHADSPSEAVPEVDITVPPRDIDALAVTGTGPYAGQPSLAGYRGRVVRVSPRTARARAAETQAAIDAALVRRDGLLARQAALHVELGQLAVEERAAIEALERAQANLSERAADAYIRGTGVPVRSFLVSDSAGEFYSRLELLSVVLEADERAVVEYSKARRAVDASQAATADALATTGAELAAAEQAVLAAQQEHEFASQELAVFLNGGSLVIHGFAFPVASGYSFGDSFGAPRMVGTEYEHWHEGTDILAPLGTELLACERGVITRVGTGVLGGITLWLKGESGTSYYYAHLTGFAPMIREGLVVETGTVLGYVGTTGNAVGGPPHVHFEVHPGGGPAINPYPILRVAQGQAQPEIIRLQL
jgi:murein DD-endopeptidase MepM/ murein hydrolase activator NlpD